jgi:hypothetical protein
METCAAEGCQQQVPAKDVFCLEHWIMVPQQVRERVTASPRSSTAHILAVVLAVEVIAFESGRRRGPRV